MGGIVGGFDVEPGVGGGVSSCATGQATGRGPGRRRTAVEGVVWQVVAGGKLEELAAVWWGLWTLLLMVFGADTSASHLVVLAFSWSSPLVSPC